MQRRHLGAGITSAWTLMASIMPTRAPKLLISLSHGFGFQFKWRDRWESRRLTVSDRLGLPFARSIHLLREARLSQLLEEQSMIRAL